MKYYVIINGNSSLDIQGLAIESLPNISKPLIRTTREEIDGRDGDVITKLGYSAYDKTLNIGLWGNYDINEVIAYFNEEGVITFSNEPDKYYKFHILNRIDFVNQLEKFKKASITIHCQPFKYKDQEAKVIEEEEHTTSGTSFNLSDTLEAPLEIDLKGNTEQDTLSGKNLCGFADGEQTINNVKATYTNGVINLKGTANATGFITINLLKTIPGGTYCLSANNTQTVGDSTNLTALRVNNEGGFQCALYNQNTYNSQVYNTNITYITIRIANGTVYNDFKITPQIEVGLNKTSYEQYCGGVPSPNPLYPQPINNVSGDNDIVVDTGKNKLNLYDKETTTYNGVSLTIEDGTITLNGTASASTTILGLGIFNHKASQSYSWTYIYKSGTCTDYGAGVYFDTTPTGNTNTGGGAGFRNGINRTANINDLGTKPYYLYMQINNGTVFTNYKLQLQIVDGTTADYDFEPYNGTTYNIDLPVENLYNKDNVETGKYYSPSSIQTSQNWSIIQIPVSSNTNYYLSGNNTNNTIARIVLLNSSKNIISDVGGYKDVHLITTNSNTAYIGLSIANYEDSSDLDSIQLELGSKANTRTPYGTTPIELNKIGTYQDYIYKENDKWYKKPMVLKIASYNGETITTDFISTTGELTTGATIYYKNPTENPSGIEITYTPLIEQLNTLEQAQSYEGTTNINQVNNDLPFIIDLTYYTGDTSITITNDGNIYSKPLLELKGTGNINIYLNGIQVFVVSLNNEIIYIDTDKMEAYYQGTLKNRQVVGDYNNFKLQSGNNTIQVDGGYVEYLKITNYSRWV